MLISRRATLSNLTELRRRIILKLSLPDSLVFFLRPPSQLRLSPADIPFALSSASRQGLPRFGPNDRHRRRWHSFLSNCWERITIGPSGDHKSCSPALRDMHRSLQFLKTKPPSATAIAVSS